MKIQFPCSADEQVIQEHEDQGLISVNRPTPDISNEAYLNDYRNRMPFHYIEEGSEGYYYWTYGSVMDIEFTLEDNIGEQTSSMEGVVDILVDNKSQVDPATGIAILQSMSLEKASNYYTQKQVNTLLTNYRVLLNQLENKVNTIDNDLYAIEDGPQYLLNKIVAGSNIRLERDTTDPDNPKLKIISVSAQNLFVTSGQGTEQNPFFVSYPTDSLSPLLSGQFLFNLIFNTLPTEGVRYLPNNNFYLSVPVDSGRQVISFTIKGAGMNPLSSGKLLNGIYSLTGNSTESTLVDTNNTGSVPFIVPDANNSYIVEPDVPFMFMLSTVQGLKFNNTALTTFICYDVYKEESNPQYATNISYLPLNIPLVGVFTQNNILKVSFGHLKGFEPTEWVSD